MADLPPPTARYSTEILDQDDDDGTIVDNVKDLTAQVVGHRIVSAESNRSGSCWDDKDHDCLVLTLDNGVQVTLADTTDCCAYTELFSFLLDPGSVDHVIMGIGTTDDYNTWHIYADWGDILKLQLGWSCGNPFYYGYGFEITVKDLNTK